MASGLVAQVAMRLPSSPVRPRDGVFVSRHHLCLVNIMVVIQFFPFGGCPLGPQLYFNYCLPDLRSDLGSVLDLNRKN